MRKSWENIRQDAIAFSEEWKDATSERAESQTFWNEFFEVFGVKRRLVGSFEHQVEKFSGEQGRADLFWPKVMLVEHKSAGKDMNEGFRQVLEYFNGLPNEVKPRYLLVSDFQRFRLHDLEAEKGKPRDLLFRLSDLEKKITRFSFMLGLETREFEDEAPVNIKASELVGSLYDELKKDGYDEKELRRFLVRLVFCLFAEDTGIFEELHAFENYIRERTQEDGSDLGPAISLMFQVLHQSNDERSPELDSELKDFPHVNGDLFRDSLRIPSFNKERRNRLLRACRFDWSKVSPAIFGSLFQWVMDPKKRRAAGAHYTSERNILKVIGPLFMDDLKAEFQRIRARRDSGRRNALQGFQEHLGRLNFLDPACGCGNFLVIAYRELRLLELEVLKELHAKERRQELDVSLLSRIQVSQFHGIEIDSFSVRIAETALWMMEHLMNRRLSEAFGQILVRIPLEDSPHIRALDALNTDWEAFLPAAKCDFVFGNPPFSGANQRKAERAQQMRDLKKIGLTGGALDYVTAWFVKAGNYIHEGKGRIGLVATNSITQGAQVGQLWPILHKQCGLEIIFAHRSFAWSSEVRGAASVHVVIIGLAKRADAPASTRLFSYDKQKGDPHESPHASLTAYLTDGSVLSQPPHLVVQGSNRPLNGFPKLRKGSALTDGGHYLFTDEEKDAFLREEPKACKFLRPFFNAEEFLEGRQRWVLALQKATPEELRALPKVEERVKRVREWRKTRGRDATLAKANFPLRYDVDVIPEDPFLVVPRVSTENRDYVPIAWVNPPAIPSDATSLALDADLPLFAILSSAMHNAWLRCVGGRLKSDFRYSIRIVYNTFPTPPKWEERRATLAPFAEAVLKARGDSVLENLYNQNLMPTQLREAHQALDRKVDRMYRNKPFKTEQERTEHLLVLYEKTAAPVVAAAAPKATGRAAKSRRRPRKG